MLRRLFLAFSVVLLPALASAQSLAGTYRAEGMNPDGSHYSGVVTIAEAGDELAFHWELATESFEGTGRREHDVIRVDGGDVFPVVYVVMPSGELHGTWGNAHGLERLIPN